MKKFLVLFLSILMIFSLVACGNDDSEDENLEEDIPKYEVEISIECIPNFIFSKYDCNIFIDDEQIGELEHGATDTFTVSLPAGEYSLRIENVEDSTVDGKIKFTVEDNLNLEYEISLTNDQIEITDLIEKAAEEEKERLEKEEKEKEEKAEKQKKEKEKKEAAESAPEPTPEPEPTPVENITIENNAEFAALMQITDLSNSTPMTQFVDNNIGNTIEFDGCVFLMMNHEGYSTRFDVALAGIDYDAPQLYGPLFSFNDVNFYDMNVSGTDTVAPEMNFHIVAEVVSYDAEGNTIELDPVSLTAR